VSKFLKYSLFLLEKKRKKKIQGISVGHYLTEFAKIPTPESLKKKYEYFENFKRI
jgi:hypothetical protein